MLKFFLSTFMALFFTACVTHSSIIIPPEPTVETIDKSTIFQLPIPVREHGYSNFDTEVLTTQLELDSFIAKVKKQKSWNQKENFISSLTLLPIDFTKYNLLLYRITESSGSTILSVDVPKGNNKHVLIEIGRNKPNMGTTDMAYYALAYKVAKSVQDITFDNGLKKDVIANKKLILQKGKI